MSLEKALRALCPGLLVAVPGLVALLSALRRASWGVVGRDQGIFQYVAWAASEGDRVYADVRDVNGPLVALVHTVLLALGGGDEHRFRVLDLLFTGLTSAFVGACLVALETRRASRTETFLRASGLALATWVVSAAHYVAYGSWDTAQRESFFDGFAVVALGSQMVALCMLSNARLRGQRHDVLAFACMLVAGAMSVLPWFGKPTFVLVTLGQLLVLLVDDARRKRTALAAFAIGGALGALPPFVFLLGRGDLHAYARIALTDVPAMYRFIWPRTACSVLFGMATSQTIAALAVSAAGLALVACGRMPRRALLLLVLPMAGLASVIAQAKGFFYHYHPVTLGTGVAAVGLVHHVWREAEAVRGRAANLALLAAGALALGLGVRTWTVATFAIATSAPAPAEDARDAASLDGEERLRAFERIDFFPFAMRRAASFLATRTADHERVQIYGMDPYLLFLARRRSATPYIYSYDLNVDAALHGSFEDGGLRPDAQQQVVIRAMQAAHEDDLLSRMQAAPPAAFVTVDRSPLMNVADAWTDFAFHCPRAAAWVVAHYDHAADFDEFHVWLRRPAQ